MFAMLVPFLLQLVRLPVSIIAVNPGCECIIYEASYGRDFGIFTSPNFPVSYDVNINCLLYTFVGNEDEIVQLTFEEFDVQKSQDKCEVEDFVKLFLHLSKAEVNEYTQWDNVLCGTAEDITQTYYSSSHVLVFEFHSDWRKGNNTGFRGTYQFLNKRLFMTEGDKLDASGCDYQFVNTNRSLSKGHFYSPRYPSNYPKNVRCAYRFVGKFNEKIKLMFENVSLQQGDESCLDTPDDIYIHDGQDALAPVIGQLCHSSAMIEIVSTGPSLFVEFVSKSADASQGFKALYSFEEDSGSGLAYGLPSTEPERSLSERRQKSDKLTPVTLKPMTSCDQHFKSDDTKYGNFSSPGYPSPYPARINCRYTFSGRGKERVQIIFTDFDLYTGYEQTKNCDGMDVVIAFININGSPERIDNFCGKQIPKQLMSNGPTMSLEFRSLFSSSLSRGFRAMYRFVTNFGISSGRQDDRSVCGFVFNSNDTTNGTFTSPNFPGFYPRNTECHYFFYGKSKEKIHVIFAYFDVEGITPCTITTASDYVEFSNFPSADRKIPRHCGFKSSFPMVSERNYLRITFRSNQRFDGTGFEAMYQFVNYEEGSTISREPSSIPIGSGFLMAAPSLLCELLFIMAVRTIQLCLFQSSDGP